MNCYFDRRFVIDFGWKYHPLATSIISSGLAADFSKKFSDLTIQTEVQFGNMARWYSDIFKFQAAYSQSLIQVGLCIVPKASLAKRIDSNVVNFERVVRELPAAELSITLPILVLGIEADDDTTTFDVAKCNFPDLGKITGRGNAENLWRVVNAQIAGTPSHDVGENLEVGPMLTDTIAEED